MRLANEMSQPRTAACAVSRNLLLGQRRMLRDRIGELAHDPALVGIVGPLHVPHSAIILIQQQKCEDVLSLLKNESANMRGRGRNQSLLVDR
jgi:hypothetical protein